jgi:hypothetical protein
MKLLIQYIVISFLGVNGLYSPKVRASRAEPTQTPVQFCNTSNLANSRVAKIISVGIFVIDNTKWRGKRLTKCTETAPCLHFSLRG